MINVILLFGSFSINSHKPSTVFVKHWLFWSSDHESGIHFWCLVINGGTTIIDPVFQNCVFFFIPKKLRIKKALINAFLIKSNAKAYCLYLVASKNVHNCWVFLLWDQKMTELNKFVHNYLSWDVKNIKYIFDQKAPRIVICSEFDSKSICIRLVKWDFGGIFIAIFSVNK